MTRTRRSGACAAGVLLGALLCPVAATAAPGPGGGTPVDVPSAVAPDKDADQDAAEGTLAPDAGDPIPAPDAGDATPAPDATDPAVGPAPDPATEEAAAGAAPVVSVPPVSYVAAGVAASVPVTVESSAGYREVTFTVDGSDLTGIATVTPAGAGCRSEVAVIRCETATGAGGGTVLGRFVVRPLPRAAVGAVGRLVVTFPGAEPAHTTVRVVPAVALAAAGPATMTYARRPGAEFIAPLRVRNAGATVLRGAELVFPAGPFHRVAERYANCRYGVRTVRCHFAGKLLPGSTYGLGEPLRLRVRSDYPAPGVIGPLVFEWRPSAEEARERRERRGDELSLVPLAAGSAERAGAPRSRVTVRVTGTRTADLRALGGEFAGAVGGSVTAVVGVRNVGSVFLRGDRGAPAVVAVIPPPGTTVRAAPRGCRLADRDRQIYHCAPAGVTLFEPGDAITWRFRLHVDRADERSGWVGVRAGHEEPLVTDNLAPLTVTTTAGAGGGLAMASAGLPVTGPPVAALITIGLLFVVAGAALCRLSRIPQPRHASRAG